MKKYKIDQKSDKWFHIRKGKITGTTLKAIMGTPKARQEALYEIIAERLTVGIENETGEENAMDRGNRLEPEAITMFEFETGKEVERVGLCEDDDNENIANSPDGLIGETEAVEVKCLGGKNYVKMWILDKVPEEYSWQVIQYFVVNKKLKKLYFVGYNPDIPAHPLHIIEVEREEIEKEIIEAKEAQTKFLKEVEESLSKIIKI
jgi:putative phage-type endonuclease